jgi:hypothetical protein
MEPAQTLAAFGPRGHRAVDPGCSCLGLSNLACVGIMNRRNATLGWLVWEVGKRVAKKKAKAALPGTAEGSSRPNASAIATLALVLAGVIWFWWSREDEPPDVP